MSQSMLACSLLHISHCIAMSTIFMSILSNFFIRASSFPLTIVFPSTSWICVDILGVVSSFENELLDVICSINCNVFFIVSLINDPLVTTSRVVLMCPNTWLQKIYISNQSKKSYVETDTSNGSQNVGSELMCLLRLSL